MEDWVGSYEPGQCYVGDSYDGPYIFIHAREMS